MKNLPTQTPTGEPDDPWANIRKHKREAFAKTNAAGRARMLKMQENQKRFLELVKGGRSIYQALDDLGVAKTTYEKWRQRDDEFRHQVEAVKMQSAAYGGSDATFEQIRLNYKSDFAAFRREFLGLETFTHMRKMVDSIERAPAQSVTMILLPPEHGKTTLIEDWLTFMVATDPNVRITVVSEGQPHARKILRRVKARLMDTTSKLYATFGPFYEPGQEKRGKPWSTDFITVCKADHDERDYSIEARGWTSAIAGTRCDYLIIDDVTSMRNHSQAERIVQTLRQDFFTRPGKDGHTIIIGTRVEQDDVYEQLLDAEDSDGNPLVTHKVILPAINHEGKALCPEMWDLDALKRKRAVVGESTWWRNYQQKPKAAGDLTFNEETLNKTKNEFAKIGDLLAGGHTIAGLDPALGGGNAIIVWSYTDKKMRIVDYRFDTGLARTEEILARVAEVADLYRIEDLVIEYNAFQKGLGNDDRMMALASRFGFRVVPHLTGGGGMSKLDEVLGVGQMASDMARGEIEVVYGDPATRARMDVMFNEFMAWRPLKSGKQLRQDKVMAAWFGWILMKNRRKVLQTMVSADEWGRKGLPYRPTDYRRTA